jgi:hypothetical protein
MATLKAEVHTMKRQLDLMVAVARKSEEKVAMLIATLKEMQEDNARFGQDLKDIGQKLITPLDVDSTCTAFPPPLQERLPKRDTDDAGWSDSVGQDGLYPPKDNTRFAHETRAQQRHPLFPNVDPSTLTQIPADEATQPPLEDNLTEDMRSHPIATSGCVGRAVVGDGSARFVTPLDKVHSPFRNATMPRNTIPSSMAPVDTVVIEQGRMKRKNLWVARSYPRATLISDANPTRTRRWGRVRSKRFN